MTEVFPSRKKRKYYARSAVSTAAALTTDHRILNMTQNVTLRYADNVSASSVAGSSASYVFRANGLFDPNFTGVGHQPRGFDQLMTLYDHYRVKTATCEVWASNTLNTPGILSIVVKDDGVSIPVSIDVMEDTYSTHTALLPADDKQVSYARFTVDVDKYLGGKAITEQKGSAGSNPTEQLFFVVAATMMSVGDAPNIAMWVRITYNADLSEPKQPVSS